MNDENHFEDENVLKGIVKWFDPAKGFGFVVVEDGNRDVLLHANVLRNFGQSSIADSSEIEIIVQETERGIQAAEIISIKPPGVDEMSDEDSAHFFNHADNDEGEYEPVRVKWFDKAKGFGFVNAFGSSVDVFVHLEVLRRSGLSDLQPGEAIAVKVFDGERGRMASNVAAWDVTLRNNS